MAAVAETFVMFVPSVKQRPPAEPAEHVGIVPTPTEPRHNDVSSLVYAKFRRSGNLRVDELGGRS